MSYTHPHLKPFFSRDFDDGKRNEKLYVLSREDGVLVTSVMFSSGTEYHCRQVLIPDFPGASPHNYSTFPETAVFTTADDVTDYVDVCGVLKMSEMKTADELYVWYEDDDA